LVNCVFFEFVRFKFFEKFIFRSNIYE